MNKIFITGCASSGTTLLRRLFYSFDDVDIVDYEILLSEFLEMESKKVYVAKRGSKSIFSIDFSKEKIKHNLEMIRSENIKILNIYRDGRDVVESKNHGTPKRWIGCVEQIKEYGNYIFLNIKYEDLVRNPNKVQEGIVNKFNLKAKHKFSEYPRFVPKNALGEDDSPSYQVRPIETGRIAKNLDYYKKICSSELIKNFKDCLRYLEYI